MQTKFLMIGTTILFTLSGIVLLFFPDHLIRILNFPAQTDFIFQINAAGWLAMATLNYTGRNAIYGGIYGKPITMANFIFGFISTLLLLSAPPKYDTGLAGWLLISVFGLYTTGFSKLLFFPAKQNQQKSKS